MKFLLDMDEVARRNWAAQASEQIAVFVHPLYEYLRRERDSTGPRVIVATTPEGVEAYKQQYAHMPRVAMDYYLGQLLGVVQNTSHTVIFEEFDRILVLRMMLPELPWDKALIIPTHHGNSTPSEVQVAAGENPWYPRVADAFAQIGYEKDFVVYGGGFMPLPDPACAGAVLLFLLGLKTQGLIRSASVGNTAVLRV